jgi:DNA-binding NarL/FixJ family response regulator
MTPEKPMSVLLVDADNRENEALKLMLEDKPEFKVVSEYKSGGEALAACAERDISLSSQ